MNKTSWYSIRLDGRLMARKATRISAEALAYEKIKTDNWNPAKISIQKEPSLI